ncbi:MAG TPA: hypothetical protein VEF76_09075 [Patescibacteria group bacterium]|nr:hypothetical protein [Patescibacteria group bacterium]
MNGITRILLALLVIAAIVWFVEPSTGREAAEGMRTSVRESVKNTKERLNSSVDAAKQDMQTIRSRVTKGANDARDNQSDRP